MNPFISISILVALIVAPDISLADEKAQTSSKTVTITGEIQKPRSREIELAYESSLSHEISRHRLVLDGQNRFALTLHVPQGILVVGQYKDGQATWKGWELLRSFIFGHRYLFVLFVEPGDSLHVAVDTGYFLPSLAFSGQKADDNRFLNKRMAESFSFQLDYEGLEAEDFSHEVNQRRQNQLDLLAEGQEEYALTPGFIDYATAHFNYEWAALMLGYPRRYRFANEHRDSNLPPDYYDFLDEMPLIAPRAIGVKQYNIFLKRALDAEMSPDGAEVTRSERPQTILKPTPDRKSSKRSGPALSELLNLSELGLPKKARARFDSIHTKNRRPPLSRTIDLSELQLSKATLTQLDAIYAKPRQRRLSNMVDLSALGLSEKTQARLDSIYTANGSSYSSMNSSKEDKPRVDTTSGKIVFRLPAGKQMEDLSKTPRLSELIDLSALGLSETVQVQIDSIYENRRRLRLSELIDLSQFGLSQAAQAQLDSLYAGPLRRWDFSRRYDLAKQRLHGRVLYWFLAGEVMNGLRGNSEEVALAHKKWKDFEKINPYPEYTEAVRTALNKTLTLQPGQPAPDFTLYDLEGRQVSLSQFKGKAIFLDFWASWCGPCIGDLAFLRKIKEATADRQVVFLNLSLDENEAAWREAVSRYAIKGIHLRAAGFGAEVAKVYNMSSLPSYYLVNSQGKIVERLPGVQQTKEIVAKIEASL
ncbi:MAG: TlpA family protein disulfide reductase [Gemmatimonadetes bacterium]|jgi:peroxiredoxin|nr:TlpA family protein disulfide reductase [Gemmatimonadota bacterium]